MISIIESTVSDCRQKDFIYYLQSEIGLNIFQSPEDIPKNFYENIIKKINEIQDSWKETETFVMFDKDDTNDDKIIQLYNADTRFALLQERGTDLLRDGLFIIGGESSSGKSSFVTDLALSILSCDNGCCLISFGLDDNKFITRRRIYSQMLNRNTFKNSPTKEEKERVKNITSRVLCLEKITIGKISKAVEFVKRETGCSRVLIAIDYFQIFPQLSIIDRRLFLNDTLIMIKDIQKKYQDEGGCILFLLSQLGRNKDGQYNYRETSEIENVGDVALDLTPIKGTERDIQIEVKKNKIGRRRMKWQTTIYEDFTFSMIVKKITTADAEDNSRRGR